jgi:hypothetical protein
MQDLKKIAFVEADKYILVEQYFDVAPFKPLRSIFTKYGAFYSSGEYKINEGFLFSANFPAINTFNTRRGACVHDFFYCLIKDGYLERSLRNQIDYYFYDLLKQDGMPDYRAFYWLQAVQFGGENALNTPSPQKQYSPKEYKIEKTPAQVILGG